MTATKQQRTTQKIKAYYQGLKNTLKPKYLLFRQWQQQPIHYWTDETEHVCNNCGHRFRGNYCPVCSQSAQQGRVSWLSLWQNIVLLWGLESRSAVNTLLQLFLRPGYLVRDYISGRRQVSYPPFKLLVILAALVTLARLIFPSIQPEPSETGVRYLDYVFNWLHRHEDIGALTVSSFLILPTWLLFRKAPLYPGHTLPEGFFLQVYMAVLWLVLTCLIPFDSIALMLSLVYSFITYKQLFGYGYWGTLWRLLVCIVVSYGSLLVIMVLFAVASEAYMQVH